MPSTKLGTRGRDVRITNTLGLASRSKDGSLSDHSPSRRILRVRRLVALALGLVVVLLPDPAAGHLLRHGDPNDTSSHLDIRVSRIRDRRNLPVVVRFYDRFRLKRDGDVLVFLDTFGGLRWDYQVVCSGSRSRGEYCDVWERRADRFFEYDIGPRDIHVVSNGPVRNKHLRWRVVTTPHIKCSRLGCRPRFVLDRAPDHGRWYDH
jgi:hypothetical protein